MAQAAPKCPRACQGRRGRGAVRLSPLNLLGLLQVAAAFQCFKGLLTAGKARRAERDQRKGSEDFDAEEAEAMEVCFPDP